MVNFRGGTVATMRNPGLFLVPNEGCFTTEEAQIAQKSPKGKFSVTDKIVSVLECSLMRKRPA